MENKFLIDHILIAVSEHEFKSFVDQSRSNQKIKYKKTITDDWTWEACYIGLKEKIYLEIVLEDKYPSRIGCAISSLGTEVNLFENLKNKYSNWVFNQENAKKNGDDWYNGYFSEQMESDISFFWFMEYCGLYRKNRSYLTTLEIPEIGCEVELCLRHNEIDDFIYRAELCALNVETSNQKKRIYDCEGRGFFLSESNSTNARVCINFNDLI